MTRLKLCAKLQALNDAWNRKAMPRDGAARPQISEQHRPLPAERGNQGGEKVGHGNGFFFFNSKLDICLEMVVVSVYWVNVLITFNQIRWLNVQNIDNIWAKMWNEQTFRKYIVHNSNRMIFTFMIPFTKPIKKILDKCLKQQISTLGSSSLKITWQVGGVVYFET